jgi:hypothetical protein
MKSLFPVFTMQFNCENYTELDQDVQFTTAAFTEDRSWYRCKEGQLEGVGRYIHRYAHTLKDLSIQSETGLIFSLLRSVLQDLSYVEDNN